VGGTRAIALVDLPRGVRSLEIFLVAPAREEASSVVNEFVTHCTSREAGRGR
jgi:hypothetical protein